MISKRDIPFQSWCIFSRPY